MIRQPAEAAQHHVFIARQPFARPQRGLPFALQDGNVIEHFDIIDFADDLLAAIMTFPTTQTLSPRRIQCRPA